MRPGVGEAARRGAAARLGALLLVGSLAACGAAGPPVPPGSAGDAAPRSGVSVTGQAGIGAVGR